MARNAPVRTNYNIFACSLDAAAAKIMELRSLWGLMVSTGCIASLHPCLSVLTPRVPLTISSLFYLVPFLVFLLFAFSLLHCGRGGPYVRCILFSFLVSEASFSSCASICSKATSSYHPETLNPSLLFSLFIVLSLADLSTLTLPLLRLLACLLDLIVDAAIGLDLVFLFLFLSYRPYPPILISLNLPLALVSLLQTLVPPAVRLNVNIPGGLHVSYRIPIGNHSTQLYDSADSGSISKRRRRSTSPMNAARRSRRKSQGPLHVIGAHPLSTKSRSSSDRAH